MLPYSRQSIDQNDILAVVEALESDWLTTGPAVDRFESAFSEHCTTQHAVSFCNGTAALHAAMFALGITHHDEVIVPAMTFVATSNCVLYQGGTPVFCDVDPQTLLIDLDDAEKKITSRTKAIIAVDYAGQPCNYLGLRNMADRYGLALISDACHSIGGSQNGRPVGSLADMTCFSFHPVKPITCGEGGMVTTDSIGFATRLKTFRNHGVDKDFRQRETAGLHAYGMTELGYNYRLSDIHAALGASQLQKLSTFTERRNQIANLYRQKLESLQSDVVPLIHDENVEHSYHLFVVRCNSERADHRDNLFRKLRSVGIGVNVHYLPVYLHPYYREQFGYQPGLCLNAESAYQQVLSLPIFPDMRDEDVNRVVDELKRALARPALQSAA